MTSMTTTAAAVIGGVDTHADTHYAAALDPVGRLLGTRQFRADGAGYRQLVTWLESFGPVQCIGVEGTGCYGAGLTRLLRRHGVSVVEVNRPDRRMRRTRGKSDPLDAENAARRALAASDVAVPKDTTTIVESIRVLRIARDGAIKARTAALNQLKDLITTAPEQLRAGLRGKTLRAVAAEAARLRPDTTRLADPTQATKTALRSVATRVVDLTAEIKTLDAQLRCLVAAAAPRTLALFAVSTQHAAQLLITAGGNPHRLRSEAAFAALCAANPIPASSGKTTRHRLNPAGDRDANATLHMIAVLRMRWDPPTRDYVARRTKDGLSKREIIRCLKRYIARQAYHAITADLASVASARPPQARCTSERQPAERAAATRDTARRPGPRGRRLALGDRLEAQ
jgi:transposase